ncbi:MAG: HAD-IC family P-type ATPase [Marivibrio sp.]|uniref:HAD-IC family P-type ATPase n=1 Tax=Marivibrio sp. TaxID=2039719 RepID=UPI0032EB81BF
MPDAPIDRNRLAEAAAETWHDKPVADAAAAFAVDPRAGLSGEEAARRLAAHGPNRLPEAKGRGPLKRFLAQFNNLLIYVLLAAGAVTAALGHLVDTGVILAVVLVNAVIGFVQEGKAESALAAIRRMLAPRAAALRDGRRVELDGADLVPGDVVLLEAGDRAPADLRLFESRGGFRMEEALLTGESAPVEKAPEPVAADAPLGDRRSLAFSGALVSAGQARGIVTATGGDTEIGRISDLMASVSSVETPLIRQMAIFAKYLTGVILALSAVILALGVGLGGYGFSELFMAVVGLSVAAIPEGLPAILTVTLAIGVQGMARRNAIVRRLPAIEALGSVSVICSDKTGTLTKNEMTVASVATAGRLYAVSGAGYAPHGGFSLDGADADPGDHPLLVDLARSAALCNDAELVETPGAADGAGGDWAVLGDPMEGALLTLAWKAGVDPASARAEAPRTDAIPFDSQHRFMATLHHDHEGRAALTVKGAPERLLALCTHQHADGDPDLDSPHAPIDPAYWRAKADAVAARGQRVLAIAAKPMPADRTTLSFEDVAADLVLLGLVGLIDPPRPEAIRAVAECRAAGIEVKMITGDHAGTAAAIARELGLARPDGVLEGAAIDALDDAALAARAQATDVFARTSPEHKLRLVQALQSVGAVVAMTGDGVNDAPALKRADIGVAMGGKGTEAAKEAAEIVLADDDFATIAAAVAAGRTVYDNLKKAILFLLPVNGGESLSLVAAILLGLTLPITPVQILWVNMVSSVALAMTLAFEAAEPGVMRRPPRAAKEPILSAFVAWRVAFVSALFCAGIFGMFTLAQAQGASVETARTLAVNTLVVMEIFYLFAVRFLNSPSLTLKGALGTKPVLIAVGAVTALQVLFTYAPFMQLFFETEPLSVAQGLQAVAVGVAVLVILEIEKRVLRRRLVRTSPAS